MYVLYKVVTCIVRYERNDLRVLSYYPRGSLEDLQGQRSARSGVKEGVRGTSRGARREGR
jgi:hypothetical protein